MTKRLGSTLKEILWQNASLMVFAVFLFVVLAILNIGAVAADDVIDVVRVGVPVSCSLEGTGMNSHTVTMNSNSTESAIGETVLKAYCNDVNGFAIYAIGYTDDIDGKNVLTSSTLGSTYDIHTGTATSGASSTWAMKLSTVTSPTPNFPITIQNSFNVFHAVPDNYTLVASRNASTDIGAAAEGSTLKTTYQAYVSSSQPAGTYIGQVKYVLVHPYDRTIGNYTINYYANGGTGTMNSETVSNMQSKTLTANAFTNSLPFNYWCASSTAPSDAYTCTGTVYQNQAEIPAYAFDAGTVLNLYAIWSQPVSFSDAFAAANKTQLNGYYKIQDTTAEICASVTVGQYTEVIDTRDNEVYYIGKLADNNCWMLDNLRLGSTSGVNLTPADTNIATNYTLPASLNSFSFNSSYVSEISNIYYKNTTATHYGVGNGKIGTYYNYCAVSAGTYCYDSSNGVDISNTLIDSPYDVCPANWGLPTGNGSAGDYDALMVAYSNNTNAMREALSITMSGYFANSDNEYIGSRVRLWSSTYASSSLMYHFYNTSISSTGGSRSVGMAVRCIVRPVANS